MDPSIQNNQTKNIGKKKQTNSEQQLKKQKKPFVVIVHSFTELKKYWTASQKDSEVK
jgi:hypothetical protein